MKFSAVGIATLAVGANAASFYGTLYGIGDYLSDLITNPSGKATGEEVLGGELRLLELGPDQRVWVDEDQMLQLKRDAVKFIDVTDHVEFYENRAGIEAVSPVVFPSEVAHEKEIKKLANHIEKGNLIQTLTNFSSFHTRYAKSDYGLESSLWLYEQVLTIAAGSKLNISVNLFDHDWKQKSLIASIPGSKNPDHVVVVGAHQDSINLLFPSVLAAPGADDDGSGTVTTLEVFRVLVEAGFAPENTVQFHWYSAEELGLWGSQAIFTKYAEDKVVVKAMLQQDMTGYSSTSWEEDGYDSLGLITDFVDPALTDFIRIVVDNYCDIPYVETSCGYACSDHASAAKAGYPSAFVIESDFKKTSHYIHSTMDTLDRLDFDHMRQHAKLTLGYAYELGFADFS